MDGPFQVFPEEVWEIILDNCQNSENVLKAFPLLRISFQGKLFSWLISDLLPLLFPKLISFLNIKNCRLVSRQWKNGVDKCLESHPDLAPCNFNSFDRVPEANFSYRRMPYITTDFFKFLSHEYDNLETKAIWKVYNPFPGRSVYIALNIAYAKMKCQKKFWTYYERCRPIPFPMSTRDNLMDQIVLGLEKAGHHISYVTFRLPAISFWLEELNMSDFMEYFIQCLERLPNIKSLKLEAHRGDNRDVPKVVIRNMINILDKSNMAACLETLDFWNFGRSYFSSNLYASFLSLFVNHSQIKKLMISAGDWNKQIPAMFPKLTDLYLQECHSLSVEFSLKDILQQIGSFLDLQKLGVKAYEVNVTEVLQLSTVQRIESLELVGDIFVETLKKESTFLHSILSKMSALMQKNIPCGPVTSSASSICLLKMKSMRNINFNFLSLLPSLKVLYLIVDNLNQFQHGDKNDTLSTSLNMVFNSDTFNLSYFVKMWEVHPGLEMVTVETSNKMYQCIRESPRVVFISDTKSEHDVRKWSYLDVTKWMS